jgi:hypothetical protein
MGIHERRDPKVRSIDALLVLMPSALLLEV